MPESISGYISGTEKAEPVGTKQLTSNLAWKIRYNIRNLTLQFLEVRLPPDSQVWSVRVSGQPVRAAKIRRQGQPITLLPLQKTSAGDFSSKVVVIYSGHLGQPLRRWTRVRPPAAEILSDIPVSRTLWTVFLPREYMASLIEGESNLDEVIAAYQQEERKLSFLDELRQMMHVASRKGKSGAREKARYNLKQVGSALEDYAQQSAQVEAGIAADVQEQAQQLEAELSRLKELKPDGKRVGDDASYYFIQPQPKGPGTGGDIELPEPEMPGDDETTAKDTGEKPRDDTQRLPEHRRGDLRKQADEQLAKLQAMPQEERTGKPPVGTQSPPLPPEGEEEPDAVASSLAVGKRLEGVPQAGQAAPDAPPDTVVTGQLSLDFELPLVGTAHHFRKLQGDPRLVLRVRHEDVSRLLAAIVWASLCLGLAVLVIQAVRRPNAAALAYLYWPWPAAVAGTIWLFLLPAGVLGLILLATALCVLVLRAQTPR